MQSSAPGIARPAHGALRAPMPVAVALALAVHATVLLGIGFKLPEPPPPPVHTFEVMTVQQPAGETRAPRADAARAQADRAGETQVPLPELDSGTSLDAETPEPSLDALEATDTPAPEPPEPPEQVLDPAEPLVAGLGSDKAPQTGPELMGAETAPLAPASRPLLLTPDPEAMAEILTGGGRGIELPDLTAPAAPPASAPQADATDIFATRGDEIAAISARINARTAERASRERRKAISTDTREYRYASYMEAWRRKVERIGNLNYPQEAKERGLYGSLILHVALKADGNLEGIRVVRSSGHAVLDQAAVRIVELAAPYAPFPADIKTETDVLDITRVWHFQPNHRLGWGD